jgi:hypothetical protein
MVLHMDASAWTRLATVSHPVYPITGNKIVMARLCIRIMNNDHPTDPTLTPLRTNEGDVVCLVDDTHVFSFAELNCGHYKIVDLPGVPQEDLVHLIASVEDANGNMTKRRAVGLDKAILKGAWKNKASVTKAELDAVTKVKP